MIYETVRQAFQNIWSNKFRTFLTMSSSASATA